MMMLQTPTETALVSLANYGLGLAAVFATGLLKKAAAKVDGTVSKADGWLVAKIKPVQPVVALGLTALFTMVAPKIGITVPPGEIWAQAPLATLLAVTTREVVRRVTG
jgi:hypothetical protein